MIVPDRDVELALLRELSAGGEHVYLAGVDEVGRGALAGPASVGVALVSLGTPDEFPVGLRDSKLMTPAARTRAVADVLSWVDAAAVGHADADAVNTWGIIGALRLAAADALSKIDLPIGGVLLDGVHDWWTTDGLPLGPQLPPYSVHMEVKGDARCAVVAAASVLAKVARDELMIELARENPGYDWEHNKGYASPKHISGLRELGASAHHRTSWKLPGLEQKL
ncbi:ribonuclease HII [Trueperella pyogenes]|uniref:Ribonuclease n=1 Tax=Trueperella pyogenes TaxID=1661 RepID=A0A2S0RJK5_9ACTO|nr:ribonuclease HII [Trueperella pyogenes]AWG03001.1 ribonuclease HII [Trueperella pyogenes]AWG15729.1 ribonuclease HII [Trueperella pyogenes]AZR00160.1 ribonuclease HII [Trueperella pyogenes]AZR03186.1 ribonuclease HII [Trueperella pyogenes]